MQNFVPFIAFSILFDYNPIVLFFSVLMKGITWSRDSHGLFDYESRHLTKKTLKASFESMIIRFGNELSLHAYDNKRGF